MKMKRRKGAKARAFYRFKSHAPLTSPFSLSQSVLALLLYLSCLSVSLSQCPSHPLTSLCLSSNINQSKVEEIERDSE